VLEKKTCLMVMPQLFQHLKFTAVILAEFFSKQANINA